MTVTFCEEVPVDTGSSIDLETVPSSGLISFPTPVALGKRVVNWTNDLHVIQSFVKIELAYGGASRKLWHTAFSS